MANRRNTMNCKKCKIKLKEGTALINSLTGLPDFIGDKTICTVSASGNASLHKVLKCPSCGYSITLGKVKINHRKSQTKVCHCGAVFTRPVGLSDKVWEARKNCSRKCAGIAKRKPDDQLARKNPAYIGRRKM